MSRKENIINNTIAYTLGNLGSKILAYVMVLVYTFYINTSDLGYYDVILSSISLLQPIALLMLDDGIYRWLIDGNNETRKIIISTCLKIVNIITCGIIIIWIIINIKFKLPYFFLVAIYFYSCMIYQIVLSIVRGLGNSKLYATSGLFNSFILLLCEIVGIVVYNQGIKALFISNIIANFLTIISICVIQSEFKLSIRYSIDKSLAFDILKYSIPIIPNNLCWWIVNSSDRYIILFFLGTTYNGIYSISNKFPTVISTVTSIFYLSIQETIIKEYNSEDRDLFYTNIFKKYYRMLFGMVLCGIPITRIVIQFLVSSEYENAWYFTGILYIATVFSALSSFLGIGYQIAKETRRSINSTVFAAILNIVVNVTLIRYWGLYAASISTLVSYIFLFLIRIKHSKKYFCLFADWKDFIFQFMICVIMVIYTYFTNRIVWLFGIFLGCLIYFIYLNKDIIYIFIKKIRRG